MIYYTFLYKDSALKHYETHSATNSVFILIAYEISSSAIAQYALDQHTMFF